MPLVPKILIVDDEASYRRVLKVIFEAEGYQITTAFSGLSALEELKSNQYDLIISDVRMPDMDGIALVKAVKDISQDVRVVMMTAFGTINTAREAFKLGADDFIQKPFNNEELKLIVKRTLEKQTLLNENRAFKRAQRQHGSLKNIIGQSEKMQKLFAMMGKVANENATILITGESGTGKELVARAVHDLSNRADKPFIPINCGAMPENLLEAELFGFLKGTFTGATQNRTGLFESAHQGTIFLDEIGDMTTAMQVKLLRVLQENKIRAVGASVEVPIDTRVIAATNQNLKKMVENGTFRQDLFYRLSVIPLQIPALRERPEDIPDLVNHFVKKFSAKSGKKVDLPKETLQILQKRTWDGNVRELENTIERAVALTGNGEQILPEYCIEDSFGQTVQTLRLPSEGLHLPTFINDLERDLVKEALQRAGGNQTRAAEILQIPVHALRHLIGKHHLNLNREHN
jgi:two-component system response regulator PilR (NtrC family)